jgi:hypothetical protein
MRAKYWRCFGQLDTARAQDRRQPLDRAELLVKQQAPGCRPSVEDCRRARQDDEAGLDARAPVPEASATESSVLRHAARRRPAGDVELVTGGIVGCRSMMKTAGLALLLLVVALEGCGGDGGTGEGPAAVGGAGGGGASMSTFKTLSVTWSVQKADGTPDACVANYPKIKVHASAEDATGNRNGDAFEKTFDCSANSGSLSLPISGDEPLVVNPDGSHTRTPPVGITGKYTVTVVVTEASGETTYQAIASQKVDLSGGDKSLAFVVTPNASQRLTMWRLYAKSTGDALSCEAAGVDHIRIKMKKIQLLDATDNPDPSPKEIEQTVICANELDRVDCPSCVGAATSVPVEYGYYGTAIDALANGAVVGTMPYAPTQNLAKVDRDTVRLHEGVGPPDFANVYFGDDYTVFIDNR